MSHVELSGGPHEASLSTASGSMLSKTASMAAPSPSDIAARQQSSHNCSTSSSAAPPHCDLRKPGASSVRGRAAFFEAMIAFPHGTSLPADPCARSTSPPSCPAPQLVLNRPLSGPPRVPLAAPTGQEVEMVDQGVQDSTETMTLNQLAGFTCTLATPDAPARTHIGRQCFPDGKHGSCPEFQLQRAASTANNSGCCNNNSPGLEQSQTAELLEPRNRIAGSDAGGDEHGIELQEQGHAEMLEHALERLKAELAERDKQSVAAASALACKTQECESLMRVVRELTENRSKLVCARTNLAEKLAEMQHEYMRSLRIADLSRVVSKENVAKTAKVMKTLKQVEDESARQQHLIGYFKERNKNLKDENLELRERLCLLEKLDLLSYSRDSVCMREFKVHALKETY